MKKKKFHREKDQRKALLGSLAVALITRGKIRTTLVRAKASRPYIERLITRAKKRLPNKFLPKATAKKLIKDIAPRYKDRPGGYIRITKTSLRKGDSARTAIIEFV